MSDSVPGPDAPVQHGEAEPEDADMIIVDSGLACGGSKPRFNCCTYASWAEAYSKAEKQHSKKSGGAVWWKHTNILVINKETKQFILSCAACLKEFAPLAPARFWANHKCTQLKVAQQEGRPILGQVC
jgi:hypothetical protein